MAREPRIHLVYTREDVPYRRLFTHWFSERFPVVPEGPPLVLDDWTLPARAVNAARERRRGANVAVVLLGVDTWRSRVVDVEIQAALLDRLAVLALHTPDRPGATGPFPLPPRLRENVYLGYAAVHPWPESEDALERWLEDAMERVRSERPDTLRPLLERDIRGERL